MTTSRAYIHACFAAMPLLVGFSALVGGSELAVASLVAGVFALASLSVFEVVSRRLVLAAVRPDPLAAHLFLFQRMGALSLVGALLAWLGPAPVAIGFGSIALGGMLHAVVQGLHAADVRRITALRTMETPC